MTKTLKLGTKMRTVAIEKRSEPPTVLDRIESVRKSLAPLLAEMPKDDRLNEAVNELIDLSDFLMDDKYSLRSPLEVKALRMMEERKLEWTSSDATLALVWKAMWSAALPLSRINDLAFSIAGLAEIPDLTPDLAKWTKAKLLRSYMKRGQRLWELNI
jgi:hypothetical protein